MKEARRQFFQRNQNELPTVEAGMGNDEVLPSHDSFPIEKHIDIYFSGPSREGNRFPHLLFDLLETVEESRWVAGSANLYCSVQKIPLRSITKG